jgi:hypothetical protein
MIYHSMTTNTLRLLLLQRAAHPPLAGELQCRPWRFRRTVMVQVAQAADTIAAGIDSNDWTLILAGREQLRRALV